MEGLIPLMILGFFIGALTGGFSGALGGWRGLLLTAAVVLGLTLLGVLLFGFSDPSGIEGQGWGAILVLILIVLWLIAVAPGIVAHMLVGAVAISMFYKAGRKVQAPPPMDYPSARPKPKADDP